MANIQPKVTANEPVDPVIIPDVATQPHPVASAEPFRVVTEESDGKRQDIAKTDGDAEA